MKKNEVRHPRFIFKLEILCGLSVIQKEVFADIMQINGIAYVFSVENEPPLNRYEPYDAISFYPINNTIVVEKIDNPDYVKPDDSILGYGYINNDLPF